MNCLWWICSFFFFFAVAVEESSSLEPDWSTAKVVHPQRCDSRGQFVSHDLAPTTTREADEGGGGRHKRQTQPEDANDDDDEEDDEGEALPEEKLYVVIHDEEEELLLQLTPNTKLVTPFTVIEWYDEDGKHVVKKMARNCYYLGKNIRSDRPSLVAVSNCDGLTGFIRSNDVSYFIEPLTKDLKKKLLQPSPLKEGEGGDKYQKSPSNSQRFLQLQKLETESNGGPRPHVIYRINSIIDKLNISLGQDQNFDLKNNAPTSDSPSDAEGITFKGGHSPFGSFRDFNRYFTEDLRIETSLDDYYRRRPSSTGDRTRSVNLKRVKRSSPPDGKGSVKEYVKGGRMTAVKGEKRRRRRTECKRKKSRCALKRDRRRAKKKQHRRLMKEKRKLKRQMKRMQEKRRRKKTKKRKKKKFGPKEGITKNHIFEDRQGRRRSPNDVWGLELSSDEPRSSDLKAIDPEKWLELAVGIDHTVIDFHGEKNVEKYIFTLFNIVSAIYQDPSLGANLHIVLLRLIFYKNQTQSQVKSGYAKRSLESVNRWAEKLHRGSPRHLRQDLAVWVTRHDLGGPSGYAPVAGICEPSRSCSLNRDEGLTSAFIIAHEMGHVLGLSHDGDSLAANNCELEGRMGSVMAPLVAATFGKFHWSTCSKKEYHEAAPTWSCLLNKPTHANATHVTSSIKTQYSLDEQCRMEFGHGFELCRTYGASDPCTFLWCSNVTTPHLCKTKKGPPLEGTLCGKRMWCRSGFCVKIRPYSIDNEDDSTGPQGRHDPIPGNWSIWTDWGPCSRTCGTGVTYRTRNCNDPAPDYGGRYCEGKAEEWKICETVVCPEAIDLRALQCHLLSYLVTLSERKSKLTWLPYEPQRKKKKCRVSCVSPSTNEIYLGKEKLFDGTRCSYERNDDICVQGKCISLGCDKEIGSKAKRDDCGVCDGDGTSCRRSTIIFRDVPPAEYTEVAILPKGAWKIAIREDHPTDNFIALRDNSSILVLNRDAIQEPARDFVSEGTQFHYIRRGEKESIAALGPLIRPVTVLIHGGNKREEVSITTSYLVQDDDHQAYYWQIGELMPCSKDCGGGLQKNSLVCLDGTNEYPVFDHLCNNQKKPQLIEHLCNQHACDVQWTVGDWEHCTKTCGIDGIQHRVVSCVRTETNESLNRIPEINLQYLTTFQNLNIESDDTNLTPNTIPDFVDPLLCRMELRPDDHRPCNVLPCPAYWKPVGWSECSETCGSGEQEHIFRCEGAGTVHHNNEVTYDCGTKPREVRVCFLPDCKSTEIATKCADESTFCQLSYLHRYCQIPKYYQLCCQTCRKSLHKHR